MANKVLACTHAWQRRWGDTSRTLLRAVLSNQAEEVERLLAQRVPLRKNEWPGKFTALHAAAISNCWRALPALLAAAAEEGLSIDSQLEPMPLRVIFSEVHVKIGLSGESVPGICKEEQAEVPKRMTGRFGPSLPNTYLKVETYTPQVRCRAALQCLPTCTVVYLPCLSCRLDAPPPGLLAGQPGGDPHPSRPWGLSNHYLREGYMAHPYRR